MSIQSLKDNLSKEIKELQDTYEQSLPIQCSHLVCENCLLENTVRENKRSDLAIQINEKDNFLRSLNNI